MVNKNRVTNGERHSWLVELHTSHAVNYRVLSHDLRLHSKRVFKVLAEKR